MDTNIKLLSPEEYSRAVRGSLPCGKVADLIERMRDAMLAPRREQTDYGSVLNDETRKLPLIVRKALAEVRKLELAPIGFWRGQTLACSFSLEDEAVSGTEKLPAYATAEEIEQGLEIGHGMYSMFGHISPDYPRVLRIGADGLRAEIDRALENQSLNEQSRDFFEAAKISLDGLEKFALRYARLLSEMAEKETDAETKKDLLRAAAALTHCPAKPPRNFFEACQMTWLIHLALQLNANRLSLGRPDQYLNEYLVRDLESGELTLDEAQRICDCFLLKFNERCQHNDVAAKLYDLDAWQSQLTEKWHNRKLTDIGTQKFNVRDEVDATNHWLQNIVLGGVKPEDGTDATCLATVMLLEAFRRLRMTNPVVSVRVHKKTPGWFYEQITDALKTGGGMPAIYNDEQVIRAFEQWGFDTKVARDYANNGCWEVIIPGRTDFYFIKLNALRCMEYTLNRGVCHVDGKKEAPDLGDPANFVTFDQLFDAVMSNVRFVVDGAAAHINRMLPLRSRIAPTPLLSAVLDGPINAGRDMTDMSTRFVVGGTVAEGVSHLIDSLCAVNELVYKQKKYTISQLVSALNANFEGYEQLRADFAGCPKYGRNDPAADEIGRRFVKVYSQSVKDADARLTDMRLMAAVGTFSWYIAVGEGTGATADGRFLGEPVASNFSPSSGAALSGVTGAIQSFCKMGLDLLPLGSPLDLGIAERLVQGDEGTARLMGLLKSFVDLGGNLMTISVADTGTLRDAQEHPERHRALRVRMGGWSAYFTMLSPDQQRHHIQKSETGTF